MESCMGRVGHTPGASDGAFLFLLALAGWSSGSMLPEGPALFTLAPFFCSSSTLGCEWNLGGVIMQGNCTTVTGLTIEVYNSSVCWCTSSVFLVYSMCFRVKGA